MPGDWDERFVAAILNGSGRGQRSRDPARYRSTRASVSSGPTLCLVPGSGGARSSPAQAIAAFFPAKTSFPYEDLTPRRRAG